MLCVCFNILLKRGSIYFSPVHSSDVLGAVQIRQLPGWDHSPVVHQHTGCSSLDLLFFCNHFSLPTSFWRRSASRDLPLAWMTWMWVKPAFQPFGFLLALKNKILESSCYGPWHTIVFSVHVSQIWIWHRRLNIFLQAVENPSKTLLPPISPLLLYPRADLALLTAFTVVRSSGLNWNSETMWWLTQCC